jgi:hypothetical protein
MLAYKSKRIEYYIYRGPIVRAASPAPFSLRMPPAAPDTAALSLPDATMSVVRPLAMACDAPWPVFDLLSGRMETSSVDVSVLVSSTAVADLYIPPLGCLS